MTVLQPIKEELTSIQSISKNLISLAKEMKDRGENVQIPHFLYERVENTVEDLSRVLNNIADLNSVKDTANNYLRDLKNMLKEIEETLKNPVKMYVIDKLYEYLGINRAITQQVIENLEHDQLINIRSLVDSLIAKINSLPVDYKQYLKEIFKVDTTGSIIMLNLNLNDLLSSANSVCQLFFNTDEKNTGFITVLLSKITSYDEKLKLHSYDLNDLKSSVEKLLKGIKELSSAYSVEEATIYRKTLEKIRTNTYSGTRDLEDKLSAMSENIELLRSLEKAYREVVKLKEDVNGAIKGKEGTLRTTIKNYLDEFVRTIENYENDYMRELPFGDADRLIQCVFHTRLISKITQNPLEEIYHKYLRDKLDALIKVLENTKLLAENMCTGERFITDIVCLREDLRRDLSGSDRAVSVIYNFPTRLLGINDVLRNILECLQNRGTLGELDVTDLEFEVVEALVDVAKLAGKNVKLVLKIT